MAPWEIRDGQLPVPVINDRRRWSSLGLPGPEESPRRRSTAILGSFSSAPVEQSTKPEASRKMVVGASYLP